MFADDRMLCGWRVRSELPLPSLLPWYGDDAHAPDLLIRIGQPVLGKPVVEQLFFQMAEDGSCCFEIDEVATYWVDATGREVVIAPAGDADFRDIEVFLLSTVLAIICFRRGVFPLHASCVEINGQAVVFCAPSGGGKSTLAATFLRNGYRVIADDVVVAEFTEQGALIYPAIPKIKLWPAASSALGFETSQLEQVRQRVNKYYLPVPIEPGQHLGRPLAAIYHLDMVNSPEAESITAMPHLSALKGINRMFYRHVLAQQMGLRAAMFATAGKILAHCPRQFRFNRCFNLQALDRTAQQVIDHLARD